MFIIILVFSMIIPIVGFFLSLFYYNRYRNPTIAAIMMGVAFSAIFYGYNPDIGDDIFRHMENLKYYKDIPIYESFDVLKHYHISSLYTWDIVMWIIAQVGNAYIIQSVGAFFGYFIISYIMFSIVKDRNIEFKRWFPIYTMSLLSFPPLAMAIGIRSANAFLLCTLAFYFLKIKKRYRYWGYFLLICAIFLHHAAVVLIALWGVVPVLKHFKKTAILILLALMFLLRDFQGYMTFFMGGGFLSGLFENIMYSANVYQETDFNNSFHAMVSLSWYLLIAGCTLRYTYKVLKRMNVNRKNIEYEMFNYSCALFIVILGLLSIIGNNALRYLGVVNMICCMLLLRSDSFIFARDCGKILILPQICFWGTLGSGILYLYDMSWGTASLNSLLLSSLFGYCSRWLVLLG